MMSVAQYNIPLKDCNIIISNNDANMQWPAVIHPAIAYFFMNSHHVLHWNNGNVFYCGNDVCPMEAAIQEEKLILLAGHHMFVISTTK